MSDLETLARTTLMRGFRGLRLEQTDSVVDDVRGGLGSLVLFDVDGPSGGQLPRNIESPAQLSELCHALGRAAPAAPLLIGIDMEGGLVCRLRERYGFGPTRSARDTGHSGDPQQTYDAAAGIADALVAAGINLNLAPCVDVDVNPDNPIIGGKQRSYSHDPEVVTEHAAAFIRAHRERGVLTCLKHFPGHGSSQDDTHVGFTDVTTTWSADELIPFRHLMDAGLVDAIMTAHVVNNQLDSVPATLSAPILSDLLREELGFEGVVISDDMGMGAITRQFGFADAIVSALNAGVDMLALANQGGDYEADIVDQAVQIITGAVESGRLDGARLEGAAARVTALRERAATDLGTP